MARDGSAIRQLSWNDVNDWFPAVHNNSEKAVTRLTPGHYPEAERGPNNAWYNAPWPLAEDLFIVAYSRDPLMYEPARHNPDYALGLYVLDATAAECG